LVVKLALTSEFPIWIVMLLVIITVLCVVWALKIKRKKSLVLAFVITVAVVGIGLLVYFKKRKQ